MKSDLRVIDILHALDEAFPFAHAHKGDQVGLLIGDANVEVEGVLVALDPALDTIARAAELGANVIVSHHPIRFSSPDSGRYFNVTHVANTYPERVLTAAIKAGVAIIAAHTNVDVDSQVRRYWGDRLGFEHVGSLPAIVTELGLPREKDEQNVADAYGELWRVAQTSGRAGAQTGDTARSLKQIAVEVAGLTGDSVKMYGDGDTVIEVVVTATGSGGGRVAEAQVAGVDLIISGEFGYHAALAAVESGLSLIEMGHDVSELPLVDFIADAIVERTGIASDKLHKEDRPKLWQSVINGAGAEVEAG